MNIPRASLLGVLLSCLLPSCAPAAAAAPPTTVLHADTPQVSSDGHRFTVPSGWSLRQVGPLAVMTVPEGGSHLALVDVTSPDADAAVRAAWAIYAPDSEPTLLRSGDRPVRQGWSAVRGYRYAAASDERLLSAVVRRHGQGFNVAILDMAADIADKRDAELELLLGSLMPKGYTPENFSGVTAHRLEGARLATFDAFIERARQELAVPGAAVGILQHGEIVLAQGYGVRQLGEPDAVDADTRFMIASNTKPLTTLMLAKLVDAGKFGWDTPVTEVMPTFTLGSAQATKEVRMRHLVCACTGLPRQDMEWIFEGERMTPASVLALVATMQPNSPIGALYQYSNLMAGAAGYIGGQVQHPGVEIGAAYDAAMQELVFDPLGMGSTTFDVSEALRGNHARPHALDLDGDMVQVDLDVLSVDQVSRPDGGAWSTVNDLLRYLRMELNYGRLTDGSRYIGTAPLLARRVQQVSRGNRLGYGIGLKIDGSTGTQMLHHGGTTAGFISDVIWWPEHDVGAVILTNSSDGGTSLRNVFRRRLMELLFDGSAEAEPNLSVFRDLAKNETTALREALTRPVPDALYQALAPLYVSPELGEIRVRRHSGTLWFDFGGWKSEMASRRDGDGDAVLVSVSPGADGFEFRLATNEGLVLSDGNRDYVFRAEY
jgi:CubicO group peptidase (beta-lactamase class C family)